MDKKKKISIVVAALLVVALAVAGVLFATNKDDNSSPEPSASSEEAKKDNSQEKEKAEAGKPSEEQIKKDMDGLTAFEDAKEVANFNKEQVQEVLRTAHSYTYNGMSNSYFLSGQWVADGMPNILDDAAGDYFTNEIREEIRVIDTNPETGTEIDKKVFPMMFYIFPNEMVGAGTECQIGENTEEASKLCLISGVDFTEMSYEPTLSGETPGLRVKYSATVVVPVTLNGEPASIEVTNDYDLNFILNENFDEEENPNKFVINFYQVQTNLGAVQKL